MQQGYLMKTASIVGIMLIALRIGEILALRWKRIDFIQETLTVAETCFLGHFGTPKSPASRREVPLSHSALGAFKAHYSRSIYREPDALVFATRSGGPLMSNNLRRGLRSACVRAGLPRLNWHALRHTHGTLLHGQGTPLKVAQAQLGHSHLTTTLEVYTHASVTAQREAVNLLEKQVFPIVPNNAEASDKKEPGALPTN
jgi:integrase